MTEPVLSCRGVIHDYDETPALLGVDLDVHEGEVVAITGPSGSGKSTLLLCLAGVIVPREGSVLRVLRVLSGGEAGRHDRGRPVRHAGARAHR